MAVAAEMRVVSCVAGGKTRLEVRPVPRPGRGELLLRLRACGLCGTDLFKLAADAARPGTVLGHEVVGTVVSGPAGGRADRDDSPFAEGDRVVVAHHVPCGECHLCRTGSEPMCPAFRENLLEPGGFSEFVLVRERAVRRAARVVPAALADESALFLEPAACVLRAVRRSGVVTPGSALVVGGGSMGLLHVAVLRALSDDFRVFVVDPIGERRELAESLGAEAAWEPARAAEEVGRRVTGGVDAVFDTVGGRSVLESSVPLTREGGTVVLFAHAAPGETTALDLNGLFKSERRLVGSYSSAPADQEAIYELLVSGKLDPSPLVTSRLPLSRFGEAVERVRSHRDLKVLLYPDGGGG